MTIVSRKGLWSNLKHETQKPPSSVFAEMAGIHHACFLFLFLLFFNSFPLLYRVSSWSVPFRSSTCNILLLLCPCCVNLLYLLPPHQFFACWFELHSSSPRLRRTFAAQPILSQHIFSAPLPPFARRCAPLFALCRTKPLESVSEPLYTRL